MNLIQPNIRETIRMHKAIDAVWDHGQIIPLENLNVKDKSRLLVVVVDEHIEKSQDVSNLRGKYKGQISSVDEFIKAKRIEKNLDL